MSSLYGELRPTNGWDLLASLGHPCKFQRLSRLGRVTARHCSVAALNRGRHLYSAGRSSRWVLAHIVVLSFIYLFTYVHLCRVLLTVFVSSCSLPSSFIIAWHRQLRHSKARTANGTIQIWQAYTIRYGYDTIRHRQWNHWDTEAQQNLAWWYVHTATIPASFHFKQTWLSKWTVCEQ